MTDRDAAGVYIEEVSGNPGPIQGESPSSLALIGFTPEGEVDKPILAGSWPEWKDLFGDFTSKSITPTEAFAFYKNGGKRLYTVRVTASDAINASGLLSENRTGELGPSGTGALRYSFYLAKNPVVLGSISIVAGTVTFTDVVTPGVLVGAGGGGGSGAVDPETGEVSLLFNTPASFASGTTVSAYGYKTYGFVMRWPGERGNDYRMVISGSRDYENVVDGVSQVSWSRHDVSVEKLVNGGWVQVKNFPAVSFTDSLSARFMPAILNDVNVGSRAIRVIETGNYVAPSALVGVSNTGAAIVSPTYDGAQKQIVYTLANRPYPTTLQLLCKMKESNLLIGYGTGATPVVAHPVGPFSPGNGTLLGSKVQLTATLTTLGLTTFHDDGAGHLTVDGLVGGNSIGTVVYATGVITLDAGGLTVPDTFVAASAIRVSCEYANPVKIVDDGNGNVSIASDSDGPEKFELNSNGSNVVDYSGRTVTVTWKVVGAPAEGPAAGGSATATFKVAPAASVTISLTGGTDGGATSRANITAPALEAFGKGLYALNKDDSLMQVVVADFQTDDTISREVMDYCELRKDRFGIFTYPEGLSPQEAVGWKRNVLNRSSSYAALYGPHIKILNPVTDRAVNIPCGGHVAGIYAKTDQAHNVSKAPAGQEDGKLAFLIGFERDLTNDDAGLLYANKINPLVGWSYTGRCVWGAKTLDVPGGEWMYIQMRRLFMLMEKSIFNSTHLHVFENNGPSLWANIRFQVNGYLTGLYNDHHFAGNSTEEAFFVTCDSTNNTKETQDRGLVFTDIGAAPTKPGEYLVFRFQQKALVG